MLETLRQVRKKAVIGFVGGSDLAKITEQLSLAGEPSTFVRHCVLASAERGRLVLGDFDYCFAENGLTAFKCGQPLSSQSFIKFIGEEKYKTMVKFILHYLADLEIPIKR
jgi:phosphomannomutase